MTYSSKQFYNFELYEKGTSINRTNKDNPDFLFPRNPPPNIYGNNNNPNIQRGFIRGIYPREMKMGVDRRLFFQFNPATLDRSVYQNEYTALPLLQNPINLTQPVPGNSIFSFQLLFNREAEVNSGLYKGANGGVGAAQRSNLNDPNNSSTNPFDNYGENWDPGDVTSIGVLADLYVLDAIVGQSITPDMRQFIEQYAYQGGDVAGTSTSTGTPGIGGGLARGAQRAAGEITGNETVSSIPLDQFRQRFEKNIGNAAFLTPMPVRLVFSSMFMVEGMVESSSVQFIKFTRNYVPTVCQVTLNVRALYFGFSKKGENTYLSSTIKDWVQGEEDKKLKVIPAGNIAGINLVLRPTMFYGKSDISGNPPDVWGKDKSTFRDWAQVINKGAQFGGTITQVVGQGGSHGSASRQKGTQLSTILKNLSSVSLTFRMSIEQVRTKNGVLEGSDTLFSEAIEVINTSGNGKKLSPEDFIKDIANPKNKKKKYRYYSPSENAYSPILNPELIGSSYSNGTYRKIVITITAYLSIKTQEDISKNTFKQYSSTFSKTREFNADDPAAWTSIVNGNYSFNLDQVKRV